MIRNEKEPTLRISHSVQFRNYLHQLEEQPEILHVTKIRTRNAVLCARQRIISATCLAKSRTGRIMTARIARVLQEFNN